MFSKNIKVEGYDDDLFNAMEGERRRQEEHIELIASENMASPRVLECQGSVLTNKYWIYKIFRHCKDVNIYKTGILEMYIARHLT